MFSSRRRRSHSRCSGTPAEREAGRLVEFKLSRNRDRTHLLGVYGLGKMSTHVAPGAGRRISGADLPARRARRSDRALPAVGDDFGASALSVRRKSTLERRVLSSPFGVSGPLVAPFCRSRGGLRLRVGCACAARCASAASNCRWSFQITPIGPICCKRSSRLAPRTSG